MSSIVISGDTSGAITLAAPAVSGTNTATLPAATGTVMVSGNMPAFSAYVATNQSISANITTKVAFNAKNFDTASAFDSTTNYRFQPTVAGYYQFNTTIYMTGAPSFMQIMLYKNGSNFTQLAYLSNATVAAMTVSGSALMYLNGSTDYAEIYATSFNANTIGNASGWSQFSGSMVRGA